MNDKQEPKQGEIILYESQGEALRIEITYEDETFWLNQKRIAKLFGVESHTITYHFKEIFSSGELSPDATTRKIRVVQREGTRDVAHEIDFERKVKSLKK